MITTINNKEIYIYWKYTVQETKLGTRKVTTCIAKQNKLPIAQGTAICNENEKFEKSSGRRISLARLLEQLDLTKGQRKIIWLDYLNRVNVENSKIKG